jgi:hypothetical protein
MNKFFFNSFTLGVLCATDHGERNFTPGVLCATEHGETDHGEI